MQQMTKFTCSCAQLHPVVECLCTLHLLEFSYNSCFSMFADHSGTFERSVSLLASQLARSLDPSITSRLAMELDISSEELGRTRYAIRECEVRGGGIEITNRDTVNK